MSLNPFTWLRNAARNAVLLGADDAFRELRTLTENDGEPLTMAQIAERTAKALPAAPEALSAPARPDPPEPKKKTARNTA